MQTTIVKLFQTRPSKGIADETSGFVALHRTASTVQILATSGRRLQRFRHALRFYGGGLWRVEREPGREKLGILLQCLAGRMVAAVPAERLCQARSGAGHGPLLGAALHLA